MEETITQEIILNEPISEEQLLENAKYQKKNIIKSIFLGQPKSGYIVSSGFKMDCNRDDIDNLSLLLKRMIDSGDTTTTANIRDFDNQFHQVTIGELSDIINELVDYGLYLFNHKWEKEVEIEAAQTVEEVNDIVW
jgi:hypothetical protein